MIIKPTPPAKINIGLSKWKVEIISLVTSKQSKVSSYTYYLFLLSFLYKTPLSIHQHTPPKQKLKP